MTSPAQTMLELADANQKDAKEFCEGAFGPFGVDTAPYMKIIAELLQQTTDRALRCVPDVSAVREALVALIEATEELAVSHNRDMQICAWDKIDGAQHKGRAALASKPEAGTK